MINHTSNFESPQASAEIEAGVVFVDLDDTLVRGNTAGMTDEQLESAELIPETMELIKQAASQGIPIVLVTRNNNDRVEHILEIKPELRPLFTNIIGIPEGQKSEAINNYLKANGIEKERGLFVDDTIEETTDVQENSDNVISLHPDSTKKFILKKREESVATHMEKNRKNLSDMFTHSNNINLAA